MGAHCSKRPEESPKQRTRRRSRRRTVDQTGKDEEVEDERNETRDVVHNTIIVQPPEEEEEDQSASTDTSSPLSSGEEAEGQKDRALTEEKERESHNPLHPLSSKKKKRGKKNRRPLSNSNATKGGTAAAAPPHPVPNNEARRSSEKRMHPPPPKTEQAKTEQDKIQSLFSVVAASTAASQPSQPSGKVQYLELQDRSQKFNASTSLHSTSGAKQQETSLSVRQRIRLRRRLVRPLDGLDFAPRLRTALWTYLSMQYRRHTRGHAEHISRERRRTLKRESESARIFLGFSMRSAEANSVRAVVLNVGEAAAKTRVEDVTAPPQEQFCSACAQDAQHSHPRTAVAIASQPSDSVVDVPQQKVVCVKEPEAAVGGSGKSVLLKENFRSRLASWLNDQTSRRASVHDLYTGPTFQQQAVRRRSIARPDGAASVGKRGEKMEHMRLVSLGASEADNARETPKFSPKLSQKTLVTPKLPRSKSERGIVCEVEVESIINWFSAPPTTSFLAKTSTSVDSRVKGISHPSSTTAPSASSPNSTKKEVRTSLLSGTHTDSSAVTRDKSQDSFGPKSFSTSTTGTEHVVLVGDRQRAIRKGREPFNTSNPLIPPPLNAAVGATVLPGPPSKGIYFVTTPSAVKANNNNSNPMGATMIMQDEANASSTCGLVSSSPQSLSHTLETPTKSDQDPFEMFNAGETRRALKEYFESHHAVRVRLGKASAPHVPVSLAVNNTSSVGGSSRIPDEVSGGSQSSSVQRAKLQQPNPLRTICVAPTIAYYKQSAGSHEQQTTRDHNLGFYSRPSLSTSISSRSSKRSGSRRVQASSPKKSNNGNVAPQPPQSSAFTDQSSESQHRASLLERSVRSILIEERGVEMARRSPKLSFAKRHPPMNVRSTRSKYNSYSQKASKYLLHLREKAKGDVVMLRLPEDQRFGIEQWVWSQYPRVFAKTPPTRDSRHRWSEIASRPQELFCKGLIFFDKDNNPLTYTSPLDKVSLIGNADSTWSNRYPRSKITRDILEAKMRSGTHAEVHKYLARHQLIFPQDSEPPPEAITTSKVLETFACYVDSSDASCLGPSKTSTDTEEENKNFLFRRMKHAAAVKDGKVAISWEDLL